MTQQILTYPNPELMACTTAERLLIAISDTLMHQQRVDIALTGGTDGNRLLECIASSPLLDVVDWSAVHIWWGDERFLPQQHPDRNAFQARNILLQTLIDQHGLQESHVHEMPASDRYIADTQSMHTTADDQMQNTNTDNNAATDDSHHDQTLSVQRAAQDYAATLTAELGVNPALDIMLFGIGPDGHFASLFPQRPQILINDPHELCTWINDSPKPPSERTTFTLPTILRAKSIWMLATGSKKAEAVANALSTPRNTDVPSSFASSGNNTLWLTDIDSISRL